VIDPHEAAGDVTLEAGSPSAEEYVAFRRAVGWSAVTLDAAQRGLAASRFALTARDGAGRAVAMARVVGDGAVYLYVQDVVVLPEWQGRGLGRRLMAAVMDWIHSTAVPGTFVGLMAADGVADFYLPYGFTVRPSDRPGMGFVVPLPDDATPPSPG
jgi:GNAT superfamily N-acetyltransferase